MNLPFFKKSSSPSEAREYFFALEIAHFQVKSAVWGVFNDRPQVLSVGGSVPWDDHTSDSLIEACDRTLTTATNHLDQSGKIQPEKVILGLPDDWIKEEKIAPPQLKLLKTLCQKLSLSAIGFVVTTEAAVRYLQNQEGVPPTAILIGIWPKDIVVTLMRMGTTIGSHIVKTSGQIVSDVLEGLSRFSDLDMLPSRMLLYDSGADLEPLRQSLLTHPWQAPQTRLPFLHFPKVELMPVDFSITAIALAGGSEVAQAAGLLTASTDHPDESLESADQPAQTAVGPQDFGFVADADITSAPDQSPPLSEITPPPSSPPPAPFPKVSFPRIRLPKFVLPAPWVMSLGLLFTLSSLFAAYWFLPRAVVTLYFTPLTLPLELSVIADSTQDSVRLDPPTIPAKTIEVTVKDTKSIPTTGSQLIGDKATGSVTVINGTPAAKSFPAGTVITSPPGLKFAFNSEVLVASASGSADPNSYKPGSSVVPVTASQIGGDSNLSAGTQFKIGSFSSLDFVAKNDSAFSGGSSKTVPAVAKKDLDTLRADLTTTLKDQARAEAAKRATDGRQLIPESLVLSTESVDFNHKLNDVADQLSLTLTITATALSISRSDLDQIIGAQLNPQIPTGFTSMGNFKTDISVTRSTSGRSDLSLKTEVSLSPQYNEENIISSISGKSPSAAEEYLKTLPSIFRVGLVVSPPMPPPLLTLPRLKNRITLKLVPADL